MRNIRGIGWAVAVILLSACTTTRQGGDSMTDSPAAARAASSPAEQKKFNMAEQRLARGIANYEKGDFKLSEEELRSALHLGLPSRRDEVSAHKYLAFAYCVSQKKPQCRHEFRTALKIDPGFDLKPAEAGHPIWGPIFASEKSISERSFRYAKLNSH